MTSYSFKGRNEQGSEISGIRDANSEAELASLLIAEGVVPTQIDVESDNLSKEINWQVLFKKKAKVSLDELIIFCRQMYSLMKAGVPMIQALRGLGASTRNELLQEALNDVVHNLEGGLSLAASLQTREDIFDNLFMSMIHVGENTGQLDTAFKQLADYLEMERETRKRIKQAVRYPTMVLGAITVAMVVINVLVIPAFASFFERFDAELPWQTQFLMATSNFVIQYGWFLLIALIGAILGFRHYINTEEGEYRWDKFKLNAPLVGGIFERIALGRFSRTFAMTYRTGVPILQALVVVANAAGNAYIRKFVTDMRGKIERGDTLTRAATTSGMFTPLVLQMLAVGEETGALDNLMDQVADFYEEEVDYDLKNLSDAIEPILIVVMGIMVLIVALGVFLPMWDLASAMQG